MSNQTHLKIVYFGTPEFSVQILQNLAEYTEISLVVTQPDRESGRGKKINYSEVKLAATELDLPIAQPVKIKSDDAFIQTVRSLNPDLLVVASFGQILPQRLLDIPRLFSLNIHASILPSYRGASPIQQAILDGIDKSGITFMRMDAGMDTGDIIETHQIDISAIESSFDLSQRMSMLACAKLPALIQKLSNSAKIEFIPQPSNSPTPNTKLLTTADGWLDFHNESATNLERRVRAMNPWPVARTMLHDQLLKIWLAKTAPNETRANLGEVVPHPEGAGIVTKDGLLIPLEIQSAGKNKMPLSDFLRGSRSFIGARLATPAVIK